MKTRFVNRWPLLLIGFTALLAGCRTEAKPASGAVVYTMPAETAMHEGTWLQWPHDFTYGGGHARKHDATWVAMTKALCTGERVHIIVYDAHEQSRVRALLRSNQVDLSKVDFHVWQTDDYWVRDNGPIFVFNKRDELIVEDWRFNGWGGREPYAKSDGIPAEVGAALNLTTVPVGMVNEGGSVELDGQGTLMAKRSSILNRNRNPGLSQEEAEAYFKKYLGATHFIWLEGVRNQDITDDHIDGTARFADEHTIVTYLERDADPAEYAILKNAKNAAGQAYRIVGLPLTQNDVPGMREKGAYINFYVGNRVVLVPNFGDPNDRVANEILQGIYPNRTIVGIPAVELAKEGGGVHCVTQQQPRARSRSN